MEGPVQKKAKAAPPFKDVELFGRSIYTSDSDVGTHHTFHAHCTLYTNLYTNHGLMIIQEWRKFPLLKIPKNVSVQGKKAGHAKPPGSGFQGSHWEERLKNSNAKVQKAAAFVWPNIFEPNLLPIENFFRLFNEALTHADLAMDAEAVDFIAWFFDVYRVLKGHSFERLLVDAWGSKDKSTILRPMLIPPLNLLL